MIRPHRLDAGFLAKFAARAVEQFFAFVDDALGNRPRAGVALRPEWTARVREKDLEHAVACDDRAAVPS